MEKNDNKNVDSIVMLRSGKTKVGKEQMKFWDIDVNNRAILKLIETKKILSIWVGIQMLRPLVLI